MSGIAIRVEDLSKRYRIGLKEDIQETLVGAITHFVKRPVRNLQRLRKLSTFSEHDHDSGDIIWALKDVSFEVKRGEVIGIIGPNGAGKTTLLKVLSRITTPTAGRAKVYGRVGSLLEVGTGFHPELTGRENIYLNGSILGMKKDEIDRKFDEIVDFSDVEKFIDTPVKRYSSGMKVRLAFAVAAHLEPEILLVDEVLAVGDVAFQKKCMGKMENVAGEGRTVLFVSHNMAAVAALCPRGVVLDRGRIIYDGNAKDAIEEYFRQAQSLSYIGLSEREDRKGSGVCRFTRLAFEDTTGQPLEVLHSGQTVRIVLDYESTGKAIPRPIKAVISIHHNLYGEVLHCASKLSGDLSDGIPPNGHLICTIKSLPLMPGPYTAKVYLKAGQETADLIRNAASVQVEEGDFYGTGKLPGRGVFLADYSWDVRPKKRQISEKLKVRT